MLLLNELPDLVIDSIVEHCLESDPHASRRTCAALCRVSTCFLHAARKALYRNVTVEHSRSRSSCSSLALALVGNTELASLVHSLTASVALGAAVDSDISRGLAFILEQILARCPNLRGIRFIPDDAARNLESAYLQAWLASRSLRSFTLVISRFRDLVLLPHQYVESLTIELAKEGDLQWDYDSLLPSWPSRYTSVTEVRLINLSFPAYSDQVMLDKLRQMCRAISLPKKLHLIGCTLSRKSLNVLLEWASVGLEELHTHLFKLVDGRDRPVFEYTLPELPHLKLVDSQWTIVKLHRQKEGHLVTS